MSGVAHWCHKTDGMPWKGFFYCYGCHFAPDVPQTGPAERQIWHPRRAIWPSSINSGTLEVIPRCQELPIGATNQMGCLGRGFSIAMGAILALTCLKLGQGGARFATQNARFGPAPSIQGRWRWSEDVRGCPWMPQNRWEALEGAIPLLWVPFWPWRA